jgi:adenosylhomocysteinase
VLLLDDGGCINITAAEGNPVEIMDLSFAAQLGAVRMLLERGDELDRAVVPIDPAVDEATARAALAAFGSRPVPPGFLAEHPADREPDVRTRRFGDPA